jgi:hypothetical protein
MRGAAGRDRPVITKFPKEIEEITRAVSPPKNRGRLELNIDRSGKLMKRIKCGFLRYGTR